jgi:hypothetical protein
VFVLETLSTVEKLSVRSGRYTAGCDSNRRAMKFVNTIILGALLYATRGNGASIKRNDALRAKGYDYVSDNHTNSSSKS